MTLTLHLVRHAPTRPNAERRYPRPQEDAPLSAEGQALARALRLPPDALAFASPTLRARETAILAGFPHAAPAPALAEANFGVMAGHTWAELEAAFGAAPRGWIEALSDPASDQGPPEGETGREFHARLHAWLAALPEAGEVVAFTHAGPLHAALRLSVGLQAAETPPGTVATLRRAEGHWWLVGLTPRPAPPVLPLIAPLPKGVPRMPTPLHPDLAALIAAVRPADASAMQAARERQAQLTKPAGALGELEDLGARLAGVFGSERPHPRGVAVLVAAGDHGVARPDSLGGGVSAYPPEVTPAMVANFLADTPAGPGGAAVNALARTVGARVYVMDAGVAADLPDHPALVRAALRRGTRDLRTGGAMTREETEALILAGAALARRAILEGADLIVPGEMGIGNTTPAAALTARLLGLDPAAVTGRGTGVDDATLARKLEAVRVALAREGSGPGDPLGVLADLGGFEIAAMLGVMLQAAALRRVVVLDGFVEGSAALVGVALAPALRDFLFAAGECAEVGHAAQLAHLGLTPLFRLGLRLGEGSGGVLAAPLLLGAAATLREMRTFAEAGVPGGG